LPLVEASTREEAAVRIEIKARKVEVTEELRRAVEKRFARIGRQVPDVATLHVELSEERNPSIADSEVAEATLQLKGVTLRARETSPDMLHSVKALAEDMRRQVKRHRDKRRKRSQTRRLAGRFRDRTA
jgi:ribosome hibernation promoting factor